MYSRYNYRFGHPAAFYPCTEKHRWMAGEFGVPLVSKVSLVSEVSLLSEVSEVSLVSSLVSEVSKRFGGVEPPHTLEAPQSYL